jgi:hypothetical protein
MITNFTNAHGMYLLDRPMEVRELLQGVILPQRQVKQGPRWGLGGVCRADGSFEPLSAYDGGWATHGGIYEWQEEDQIDEDVVYFGTFFNHWGHFLIDMIGRLWYYAQGKGKGLKLAYIGEETPGGNFLEVFRLLGVEPKDLLPITKPTRFRKVIVPEFCCKSCEWYSNEYREIFNTMIRRVAEEHYEPEAFRDVRKVYFARTSFGKAKATEFGEENIVTWMKANGFTPVAPETLSVKDQIYLWNHADEIACLDGSISMSVAFSNNPKLKFTVLHKTSLEHRNLELYLLMRPCDVTLLDVWHEPYKNYPKNIGGGPFLLHLGEDAKAYSRQRGWEFPFEEKALLEDRKVNQRRMLWSIINIKGRTRRFLFAVTPQFVKNGVRRLRGHES